MANKRVDILIYSGTASNCHPWSPSVLTIAGKGSTEKSVQHCFETLSRLLSANYAVKLLDEAQILNEPWTATCALLVMPGGADLGYCETLRGHGNRRIRCYVEQGGSYLGFCAGACYGSRRCEWEVGNSALEVVGDRELAFFPGIYRGLAFPGFIYNSEIGARAVELKVHGQAVPSDATPEIFRCYYNGGGVFVNAPRYFNNGTEIIAEYTEDVNIDPGDGRAAVVYCRVGNGGAILCSTHPE